jgi:2'-hydroxyisoflavone reductase
MKLLVLGGTGFLGRHFVEVALAAGHEITLFNRGQSNPDLFPGLEKLRGDRYGSLDALRGRAWDAVIDTTGYTSAAVRAAAELLAPSVAHYTFVSSMSVYSDDATPGQDESGRSGNVWSAQGAVRAGRRGSHARPRPDPATRDDRRPV